jgi:pimeloyl-ACP methyl ester carboxylesterase
MAADEVRDRIEQLRLLVHYARAVLVPAYVDDLLVTLRAAAEWRRQQASCTPTALATPTVGEHRVVVEVAGLGSHQPHRPAQPDEGGAVFEVDTTAIYQRAEVYRFSYRGGTTDQHGYSSADTQGDIRQSGRRLRELLERLQYQHPGVPIDLIAHSQGGLVVRSALGDELDWLDPRTPRIANVVTLGTPHHGANLATAGVLLGETGMGDAVETVAGKARIAGIDPKSKSVRQLAETSSFIRDLNRRPVPDGVRFTSIAARGDPVVPSPRAHLSGATNVIVDVPGVGSDHDHLPGSDAATREIALAVNARGPTCQRLADAVGDALYGAAISRTEDQLAVLATVAAAGPQ